MIKYGASIVGILLISGCASERKKQLERNKALERTQQFTRYPITHQSEYTGSILTRNIAVSTALQNNAHLQSDFEQLGVAQADLEKAGVFTNPYLDAIFAHPKDKTTDPALTFYLGILKVSDLWLVPIKKKIAEDDLEMISWQVTTHALKVIRDTQLAYNACIQAYLAAQLAQEHTAALQSISTSTHAPQQEHIHTDFKIKIDSIKHRSNKKTTIIHLQQLMGVSIDPETQIETAFSVPISEHMESIRACMTTAQLAQHPTMVISNIRITRAQHQLSYERRRCMEDITLGYNYVKWFDGVAGSGPFFHMSFPIGDTTHASQRKAQSMIAQYEQETQAALQQLQGQVEELFVVLQSTFEQIELMRTELRPHVLDQLHHHQNHFKQDATDTHKQALVAALNLQCETEQSYINLLHTYHDTLVKLDYLIGGGILKRIYGYKNSCT